MYIYSTGHAHSEAVCDAIRRGAGLPLHRMQADGSVALYGFLRGGLEALTAARAAGKAWVYGDRGYFNASRGSDYSGYFRFTRNAWQHDGRGEYSPAKWQQLGLPIWPWRKGRHILVCPPGDIFTQGVGGFAAQDWLRSTLAALQANTDRPVRVRLKPEPGVGSPLQADLNGCHALVTYMSNTAVEAVLAGVPVYCDERSAACVMGKSLAQLNEIECPAYPQDRARWAAALAANQWTLAEVAAGLANHLFVE